MNYKIIELNGKELKFKLKSKGSIELERKYGKTIFDLISSPSVTNICILLKYMRKGEIENFSDDDSYNLYDELVDNGYTIEKIMDEIIYPTLVVSGFLSQADLEKATESVKQKKEEAAKKN